MSRHVREYGQQRRFIFTGDIPRVWLNASDQQKKRGFTIRAYTVDPGQPQPNITIPAGQPQALEGTAILNIGAVPLTGQQKQIARSPGFNRPQVSLTVLKYPASNPNRLFMFDRDIVIGRGLDNDVVLPDEPRISRQHARIEFKYGQFLLTDLNSSNGTAVNGRPITQIVLAPGDTISLGGVEILFSVEA
jgi:pSer/pThr/pTyr-binding forkhead associated (FHA) protein